MVFWNLISKYCLIPVSCICKKKLAESKKKFIEVNGAPRLSFSLHLSGWGPAHFRALALHLSFPFASESQSQDATAVLFFSAFSVMEEMRWLAGWSKGFITYSSNSVQVLSCNCIVLAFICGQRLFTLKGHWNVYFTMCPYLIILLWVVFVNKTMVSNC